MPTLAPVERTVGEIRPTEEMVPPLPSLANSPAMPVLLIFRLEMVWALPSKVALKVPMGDQLG